MLELKIEDGLQEVNFNGKVSVLLNLTDISFIERFFIAFDEMSRKQEEYTKQIDTLKDDAEVFNIARKMDAEMRSAIDGIFECPVCEPLFGRQNVYAMGGGVPLWANLMLAVIEEMDNTIATEKAKENPRLEKYLKKYRKK